MEVLAYVILSSLFFAKNTISVIAIFIGVWYLTFKMLGNIFRGLSSITLKFLSLLPLVVLGFFIYFGIINARGDGWPMDMWTLIGWLNYVWSFISSGIFFVGLYYFVHGYLLRKNTTPKTAFTLFIIGLISWVIFEIGFRLMVSRSY